MRVLITGTESFTHYMTIAPVIHSFWERHGITEILTPGRRGNGIDCAAKIFAQVNGIRLTEEINPNERHITHSIIFWDGKEGYVSDLIKSLQNSRICVMVESIPYSEPKWYKKIKKTPRKKTPKKKYKEYVPASKSNELKFSGTLDTKKDRRPAYKVNQSIKQIRLPQDFDRSSLLKEELFF